jgi:hypothetical protein
VLLDEGIHFQSQLLDCPPEDISTDLRLEATFVQVSDHVMLVRFRRAWSRRTCLRRSAARGVATCSRRPSK